MRHTRFSDGTEADVGMDLSDDDILQKAYDDSRDYEAELEEAYHMYVDSMTDEKRYDYENRITRVKKDVMAIRFFVINQSYKAHEYTAANHLTV